MVVPASSSPFQWKLTSCFAQPACEEFPQVNLAFSLHSPFAEERNQLVRLGGEMDARTVLYTILRFAVRETLRLISQPARPLNRMFPMEEALS